MFTGCGTALVTPFRRDLSLDEETLRRLVRRQMEAGVNFLVPCGTTGESPTLTRAEHLRVVGIALEEARGKVPVLAGVIPLKSAGMARFMNKSVAGINVPQSMIDKISKAEDKTKTGIEMCGELIKQLKGMCQGVHIMPIGWEKKVPDIIKAAGL